MAVARLSGQRAPVGRGHQVRLTGAQLRAPCGFIPRTPPPIPLGSVLLPQVVV